MAAPQELLLILLYFLLTLSPCLAQFCSWDKYNGSDTTVDMRKCGLRELPPAPPSLTEVESLFLNANIFNHFPNITALAESLSRFEIGGNVSARSWFTSIEDDLITPLVNLQSINIAITQLDVFPNLTMAGHSLLKLNMVDNPLSVIPPEISTSFTNLADIMLYFLKLTHFPDIRNSGESLRNIQMQYNRITNIPIELTTPFTTLESFKLPGNRLSQFPDLTNSNATLSVLDLNDNSITDAPASLTTPFTALRAVELSNNLLTQMPDFSNSASTRRRLYLDGNNITDAPASLTTCFTDLRIVDVSNNLLTEIPDFTNSASTFKTLKISGNKISVLSARRLRPLVNLETLYVNDNPIKTFPHLPGLTKLKFIGVANTHLTHLPPLWPQDPLSMTLALEGSTLDLCSCRNLWIKQAQTVYSASLTFTDQMCASGQSWSSYSMDWLRADCADDKQQKRVKSGLTEKASLSPQPGPTLLLHSYLPHSDHLTCTFTCLQTASCVGFWLGPAGCIISAPTADPVTVPGVGDPVWTFYGIK